MGAAFVPGGGPPGSISGAITSTAGEALEGAAVVLLHPRLDDPASKSAATVSTISNQKSTLFIGPFLMRGKVAVIEEGKTENVDLDIITEQEMSEALARAGL